MERFVNILPTNTIIAAKQISTFSFCPKYVSNTDKIAFVKNPDTKILISKFPFTTDVIPPNTESSAAMMAIAKYPEYVYDIVGAFIPKKCSY